MGILPNDKNDFKPYSKTTVPNRLCYEATDIIPPTVNELVVALAPRAGFCYNPPHTNPHGDHPTPRPRH